MKPAKEDMLNVALLLSTFIFMTLAIHEYGHAMASYFLGYSAQVEYNLFSAVTFTEGITSAPMLHRFILGSSGGFVASIFFLIMGKVAKDLAMDLALAFFCINQVTYGLVEGLYWIGLVNEWYIFIPYVVALSIFVISMLGEDKHWNFYGKGGQF